MHIHEGLKALFFTDRIRALVDGISLDSVSWKAIRAIKSYLES